MRIAVYTIALNEEKHVKKWYESAKDADYLLIADTGSTDNTPDIIREELKDTPGQLHFSQFTNFKDMRNMAFDLASKSCKYMIVIDDSY